MKQVYHVGFVTACFCRGMDTRDNAIPEIRPSSIRGQLRQWHRMLFQNPISEKELFGGIGGKNAVSSKVVIRVADVQGPNPSMYYTLPHKIHESQARAAAKGAFPPGTQFSMQVLDRREGLNENQEREILLSIEAWLLMGGLGLRVTRAAGSLDWNGMPTDVESYKKRANDLIRGTKTKVAVLDKVDDPEALRFIASDTIGGFNDRSDKDDLRRMNYPLGNSVPRKTSPLRFTVRRFQDGHRLVAIWDGLVAGRFPGHDLVRALQNKKIGDLLSKVVHELS
jgi:CRISPR type III-B/RAMP module RAMP protein Cmr1